MVLKRTEGRGDSPAELIGKTKEAGRRVMSEYDSSRLLAYYGVTMVETRLCTSAEDAGKCAGESGGPVVLKLCSPDVPHKKEKGFVKVGLSGAEEVVRVARGMLERAAGIKIEGFLVQKMCRGERELLAGMRRDRTFGPCVTLGVGGIFTEAIKDISLRVAPVTAEDTGDMLDELHSAKMFGAYRGLPPVDRAELAKVLIGLGEIGLKHPEVSEIDVNPLIIDEAGRPVAVDALVILGAGGEA